MNAHTSPEHMSPSRLTREQVMDLIQRYPRVSESEAKQILAFLRRGRQLDIGMITADEQLKPQLDSFMEDHASHFRVGLFEGARVIAAIVGFLLLCGLLWEATRL
jgi:hypothetical protein